jgi:hypothetical protein
MFAMVLLLPTVLVITLSPPTSLFLLLLVLVEGVVVGVLSGVRVRVGRRVGRWTA